MDHEFFQETYPIILCYSFFILSALFLFVIEISKTEESDIPSRGWAGAVIAMIIAENNLSFRIIIAISTGFIPAYFMIHGWIPQQYIAWAYGLIALSGIWLIERIIRQFFLKNESD